MIILHGENTVASRNKLAQILSEAKTLGTEIIRLEAKKISQGELESVLGAADLFGTKKLVVLEELHSLPRSKKKNELISLTASPTDHEIVLWEKRALTKTMAKQFPQADLQEFKMSNSLFSWLDSIGSPTSDEKKLTLLHEAIKKDSEYLCFIMLVRHIRLLLLAKTGGKIKGPPFMVSKYSKQSRAFSEEKLLELHTKLVEIDEKAKTSSLTLNLQSQLDLFTLGVYI